MPTPKVGREAGIILREDQPERLRLKNKVGSSSFGFVALFLTNNNTVEIRFRHFQWRFARQCVAAVHESLPFLLDVA